VPGVVNVKAAGGYQQRGVDQPLPTSNNILWATKKVTFFENWLLFLIGQYFMYVLENEK
jgi:hypothetical protein